MTLVIFESFEIVLVFLLNTQIFKNTPGKFVSNPTPKHVITITNTDDPNENYNFITEKFLNVLNAVNSYVPLKRKR